MYKVLIADDEDIICRGLAGMVSRCPKLQVVALAEDGELALEKALETLPDLMFVDINMPFLNGLEFIERIRESLPNVLIIIVTGYDDFKFVQKALRLGAMDYVLKPVMEQPFFEVLDRAVERLDSMDVSRKYIDWMEEWVEQNRPKIIDDFFNSLFCGQLDEEAFERQMGYLRIEIPVPYAISVFHIYSDHERDGAPGGIGHGEDAWYRESCRVIRDCFEPYSEILCFQTEEGAAAVVSKALLPQQWARLELSLKDRMESELCARLELVRQQGDDRRELRSVFRSVMESYRERSHYSEAVLRTISIIRTRWGDSELSLQSVADELFVSAAYLSRMFHRETGETFAVFLARKRINEAKFLLKNTNMKMYEIAQKTGYTSQHYFSNAFKKAMGIAPADYRKNLLN